MPKAQNLPPRPCDICGKEFVPAHKRGRYCSKPCLWKSKNQKTWATRGEEIRSRNRARYHANPERYRAMGRASHAKHREQRASVVAAKFQKQRLETPWRSLLASRQTHAKQKGLPFDLTEEWAIARWTGECEVTGIPFLLGQRGTGPKPYSPSIDKIDPCLGYIQSNCRFVIHAVNALKGTLTDAEMIEIARAIIRKYSMD